MDRLRNLKHLVIGILLLVATEIGAQSITGGVEINVQNNDEFAGFEMLDSAVLKARVVMTGENHSYVKFNSKMELKMLRFLNKKVGTRHFVIELGEARAHFLNRYINESDTMADRYLRATTSPRYMDLFKRMRKFNKSLPDSLKITVHGIDVERFNDLPLFRLSELLPREDLPPSIRMGVDAVHGAVDYLVDKGLEEYELARDESGDNYNRYGYSSQPFYVSSTIYEFLQYYDSLKVQFATWLGDKKPAVDEAVHWLRDYKQWMDYDNTTYQYIWREEHIFRNLSSLVKNNPQERFYGQFGRCHIAYEEQNGDCGWYGYHSVINKMRTRYFKSADSIVTIGLFYSGNGDNNYYSDKEDDEGLQKEIDALLETANKKAITLFNLKHEDSDLTKLAGKFSYAIVNDNIDEDIEDSVESEVITDDYTISTEYEPHFYFGLGYTFTSTDVGVLGVHLANNGLSTNLNSYQYQNIVMGINGLVDQELKLSFMPHRKLYEDDSSLLRYNASQINYRLAYPFLKKRSLQLSIGANVGYAGEKMEFEKKNTSFLEPQVKKYFIHKAFIAGPSAQVNIKMWKYLYAGIQAAYVMDFSANQWKYKGSTQLYGTAGQVSSGFGGMYYSFCLGLSLPLDEGYTSDYY